MQKKTMTGIKEFSVSGTEITTTIYRSFIPLEVILSVSKSDFVINFPNEWNIRHNKMNANYSTIKQLYLKFRSIQFVFQ